MDTASSNRAVKEGMIGKIIEKTVSTIKPEAAYFTTNEGQRSCMFFFDMKDASQLPTIVEPFFQELNASVEVQPCMNQEDLQKGLQALR
jgi:hypothetical protein